MRCGRAPWWSCVGRWLGVSLGALGWVGLCSAQALPVHSTVLEVQALAGAPELVCAPRPAKPARPAAPPVLEDAEPVVPDAALVQAQLQAQGQDPALSSSSQGPATSGPAPLSAQRWLAPRPGQPLRVALWGDSHLAAGFFSQELARLLELGPEQVQAARWPAAVGRAGVRLALRKSCTSGAWRYEVAHTDPAVAERSGPGLVSMVSAEPGASVAWDLRSAEGQALRPQWQLLYEQGETPVLLSVQADGGEPQTVRLQGSAGPGRLLLQAAAPLSTLRVTVLQGRWRWHALQSPPPEGTRLQLDVFGIPGATVAGWKSAVSAYNSAWWGAQDYELVVLAFGTNEGNVQPFDAGAYAQTLTAAVAAWRAQFPHAACALIGPGDRGVLVPRAPKRVKGAAKAKGAQGSARAAAPDLLRFTRVHAQINALQQEVAQAHGCRFWSAQQAMGGAGSAYRWQAQQPAWMARDLIHFTVPGYQQLARLWAADMGWGPALLEPAP